MKFRIIKGETEHITLRGKRVRNPTVLLQVGRVSLSWRAALLGVTLVIIQILDGFLTFAGVSVFGTDVEGNVLVRDLVSTFGAVKALFFIKAIAVVFVILLTLRAHRRRWIRPIIMGLVVVYFILAIVPWAVVLSRHALWQ